MYTLKVDLVNDQFVRAAQALIQENGLWSYSIEVGIHSTSLTIGTMSIRELKRFVDLVESEEFMRDCHD